MMVRLLPSVSVIAFSLFFSFLLPGCSMQDETEGNPSELYRKAAILAREGAYEKAIALYDKAIATDTLKGLSARPVLELYKKRHLEGLFGDYSRALHSTEFLEKHAGNLLSDSLRATMLAEKSSWLSELGDFRGAEAVLAAIADPSEDQLFEKASLACRNGNFVIAQKLYSRYASQENDPVSRMRAVAGLLRCSMRGVADTRRADELALSIVSLSGKVLALKGDLTRRIHALRESALCLQLLEKHRRNASYLLFRALALAEQSGNPSLVQLLRYESNAMIVHKPVPYSEAADFFDLKGMQFAEAAARLRLATDCVDLTPSERIDALRRGLQLFQNYQPAYPGPEMVRLAEKAQRQLAGLLVREKRVFELYDALEQFEMLALQKRLGNGSGYFRFGKQHEALERQVRSLQQEIAGLLQRKADIFLNGRGFDMNPPAESALQVKRGRLFELLGEVEAVDPAATSVLQLKPVTLQTLQRVLKNGQLVVKPVVADSFYTVMTLSNREIGIAGSPVMLDARYSPDTGLRRLAGQFALRPPSGFEAFRNQPDVQWFSRAFAGTLDARSSRYDHFLIVADPALPVQLFGSGGSIAYDKKISMTVSFREIVHTAVHPGNGKTQSMPRFYPADRIENAQLYKLFHPEERVFLLWKPFESRERDVLKEALLQKDVAELTAAAAVQSLVRTSRGAESRNWFFVSAYGSE
jgi:tetratricopeptide (TPR) repeat protein